MLNRIAEKIRSVLLYAAGNVSLFVFTAYLVTGVLCMEPMVWYREQINLVNQYVVFPWGMALCLLRLERLKNAPESPARRDIAVLFVLLLWIIVPFALRFGITFNNIGTWYNHAVAYFGIYAFLSQEEADRREKLFDIFLLLCGAMAFVLGILLLYCAVTATTFYHGAQEIGFGLYMDAHLCHGVHYNITGMLAVCLSMLCLAGVMRARWIPLRVMYILAAAMMLIVTVLTQSRTARYAVFAALAAGTYSVIVGRITMKRRIVRQAVAVAAAAAVLVASYVGASILTDAALEHYKTLLQERADAQMLEYKQYIDETLADDSVVLDPSKREEMLEHQRLLDAYFSGKPLEAEDPGNVAWDDDASVQAPEARAAVDSTLSGRTDVWKNLFRLWKDNPKHFLIGNGVGRTGSRVVDGTIHEEAGSVSLHNTYLQHTADFGLIGTLILAVFYIMLVKPLLGVFFARDERRKPGYAALCMLVIACLATGMMESAPLGAMSPMNMILMFALALLAGRARDLALL